MNYYKEFYNCEFSMGREGFNSYYKPNEHHWCLWFEFRIYGYGLDFEITSLRKYWVHFYPFYHNPLK